MSNRYPTLQAFVAAFATPDNETGDVRRQFDLFIEDEPVGPGVDSTITVLTVCPHGFEYLMHRFALDGAAMLTPEQIDAKKQFMVNEAAQRNLAAQQTTATLATVDGVKLGGVA